MNLALTQYDFNSGHNSGFRRNNNNKMSTLFVCYILLQHL